MLKETTQPSYNPLYFIYHVFNNVSDLVYDLNDDPPEGFDEQETVQPYNAFLHRVVQQEVAVKEKMAALKEIDKQNELYQHIELILG